MADYKYVKKFVILDKGEFWIGTMLIVTGPLCLMAGAVAMLYDFPPGERPETLQIFFLMVIGIFNTLNGAIRLDKKPYEVKRKRIKLTEAEKLLGD